MDVFRCILEAACLYVRHSVLINLTVKPFVKIVGNGENAVNQHFLLFIPPPQEYTRISLSVCRYVCPSSGVQNISNVVPVAPTILV